MTSISEHKQVFNNTKEYTEKLDSVYVYTYPSYAELYGRNKIGTTTREPWLRISEQTAGQAEEPILIGIFNPKELGLPKKFWKNKVFEKALLNYYSYCRSKNYLTNPSRGTEWFDFGPPGLFKDNPELYIYKCKNAIRRAVEDITKENLVLPTGLKLLPHQDKAFHWLISNNFFDQISGFDRALFWWKCGAGKTFISFEIIEHYINLYSNITGEMPVILWVSAFPVLSKQIANMLKRHFVGCKIFVSNEHSNVHPIPKLNKNELNIVFVSIQDMDGGNGTLHKHKFANLPNKWDLLFLDEIHQAVMTARTQGMLWKINYKKLIGLSATPAKNILGGMFDVHQIHRFSLIDEKSYKNKYPEQYRQFPDIKWLIWRLFEEERHNLKQYPSEEQFTFQKFFSLLDGEFVYKDDVIYLVSRLIGTLSNGEGNTARSPLEGKGEFNFIQSVLWYLPNVVHLEPFQRLLQDIPEVDDKWNVYYTSADENNSDKLFDKIKKDWKPKVGRNRGKNTIILAVEQLTTGVTIPYLDMVILCNDKKSIDWYEQVSYRPQRPDPSRNKTKCFVLDLNPARLILMLGSIYNREKRHGHAAKLTYQEWYENVGIFNRNCRGQFVALPFQDFINEYNTQLKSLLTNPRMNIFHFHDEKFLLNIRNGDFEWIELLDLGRNSGKDQEKKLPGGIDKGKNSRNTKPKSVQTNNNSKEKLLLELGKSLYERALLICVYTRFKKDTFKDSIEHIRIDPNKEGLEKSYLTALLLNESLVKEISLDDVEKFYHKNCGIDYINQQIHSFNQQIVCVFELINSSPKEFGIMIEKAIELIGAYLKPSKTEKKNLGEVFTPFELINQMLDELPKEVWSDPNLKLLDPANGIGNFPAIVIQRLMEGLKKWEPDDEKRLKHIIENMIYVCDIQPKNMFLYLQIFDYQNQYKMNYYRGSFLDKGFDEHMKKKWNVDKFDVIIGNPPYNNNTGNKGRGHSLWDKFVIKDLCLLSKGGFLVQVHPGKWRLPGHKLGKQLTKYHIIWLGIHDEKQGLEIFNSDTRFDCYILQKKPPDGLTKIKDQDGNIVQCNLQNMSFIPNKDFELVQSLLAKPGEKRVEILKSESFYVPKKQNKWMSKEKTETHKLPCVYTLPKSSSPFKTEPNLRWSSENRGHFGTPKVIWSMGRPISVGILIDKEGKYGLTQWATGIVDDKLNLEKIALALHTKRFRKLCSALSVSKLEMPAKIIALFRKDFWKEFPEEGD